MQASRVLHYLIPCLTLAVGNALGQSLANTLAETPSAQNVEPTLAENVIPVDYSSGYTGGGFSDWVDEGESYSSGPNPNSRDRSRYSTSRDGSAQSPVAYAPVSNDEAAFLNRFLSNPGTTELIEGKLGILPGFSEKSRSVDVRGGSASFADAGYQWSHLQNWSRV